MASDKAITPAKDESAKSAEQQAAPAAPPPAGVAAILNDEIEILPHKPLPDLDRGPAKAYAARAKNGAGKQGYFALLCDNAYVPRPRYAAPFAGIINPNLVKLVASGVVYWPPASGQRYVFVYENSLGRPLIKAEEKPGLGWKQEQALGAIIKPMVDVMLDMRDADLVHGCINPMNMFDGGSEIVEKAILGECLSLPPGMGQPALYEPVERAMSNPVARGMGTFEDDLYSLGVTLTVILRQRDPLEGMSDEEIIRHKIEMGSYGALVGKERFTGAILELLRGLLYDDRSQRWTLDEVQTWLEGQRLSPKQSSKKQKAARPIHFNEERYFRPGLLAMDLDKNQSEAVQMVESGQMQQWIERSLEDAMTGARYEQAFESAQEHGRGPGYWDRLLSRVSIALDPEAPIRFRNVRAHPDGLPYALSETFARKGDLSPFVDIINQNLVVFWLNAQTDLRVDVGTLVTRYDSCRTYLRQATIGYGIERCLYFLNRDAPCMSERLKGFYVRTPEDMMYAFEQISARPNRPELFIDRHIAAFLSVKDRKDIDAYFIELNAEEFYKRVLGNLRTLATIQKRSRMEGFPGICAWIAAILDPVYERYHDRLLRQNLKAKVEKIAPTGDLTRIAVIFDDVELSRKDFEGFRRAMVDYARLRNEHQEIETKMANPATFGKDAGREVAAIVSGLIAGIIILVFAFMYFTGSGMF